MKLTNKTKKTLIGTILTALAGAVGLTLTSTQTEVISTVITSVI